MNRYQKIVTKIVIMGLLSSAVPILGKVCKKDLTVAPYYSIRSQGANVPRQYSSLQNIPLDSCHVARGLLAITGSYQRTFDATHINRSLFGSALQNNRLTISGSRVSDRGSCDLLADYFYLPTDYKSFVYFNPRIDNIIFELHYYIDLCSLQNGLYLEFHAPLVHTRWLLECCERIENKGVLAHPAGYFTPQEIPRGQLLNGFCEFLSGRSIDPIVQNVDLMLTGTQVTQKFTTVLQPLQKARVSSEPLIRTRLADLRARVGWDFYCNECSHAGVTVNIAAPVGNKPNGSFLFEPIAGNGHHWELGIGLNGHYQYMQNNCFSLTFYAEGYITHLFPAHQSRTFDLKNSPLSRYMLAERVEAPVENALQGGGVAASAQFKREFTPVANLTTFDIDVNIGFQTEITLVTHAEWNCWYWDLGYNFWARSCESITVRRAKEIENNTRWALKGDSHVYGFLAQEVGTTPENSPIALSATQRSATINSGQNFPPGTTDFAPGMRNPNIDNPQPATATTTQVALRVAPGSADQIQTSIQPQLIIPFDVNLCDAETMGRSSSIFSTIGYVWDTNAEHCWTPSIAIGGKAEFAHNKQRSSCDGCQSCAISQWEFWIHGSLSFK